jgi:putative hemolysin
MKKKTALLTILLSVLLLLTACGSQPSEPTNTPQPEAEEGKEGEEPIGMANPASVYCQELGYKLKMRETEEGTIGVCIFPDGEECEEWDFLSGRCGQEYSFCVKEGYTLKDTGGNIAECVFPGGSSCPEYDFFTGDCQP